MNLKRYSDEFLKRQSLDDKIPDPSEVKEDDNNFITIIPKKIQDLLNGNLGPKMENSEKEIFYKNIDSFLEFVYIKIYYLDLIDLNKYLINFKKNFETRDLEKYFNHDVKNIFNKLQLIIINSEQNNKTSIIRKDLYDELNQLIYFLKYSKLILGDDFIDTNVDLKNILYDVGIYTEFFGINIDLNVSHNIDCVNINSGYLYFLFYNMISNSSSVERGNASKIFIKIYQEENYLFIDYIDNGNGIKMKSEGNDNILGFTCANNIFKKGKSGAGSTGIGLSNNMDKYGGELNAYNYSNNPDGDIIKYQKYTDENIDGFCVTLKMDLIKNKEVLCKNF